MNAPARPNPFPSVRPTPADRYAASLALQVWNEARRYQGLPPVDEKTAAYQLAVESVGPRRASGMHNVAAAEERRATVYHESHDLSPVDEGDPEGPHECAWCECTTEDPAVYDWCTAMPRPRELAQVLANAHPGETEGGLLEQVQHLVADHAENALDRFAKRRGDVESERRFLRDASADFVLDLAARILEGVLDNEHVELTRGQLDAVHAGLAAMIEAGSNTNVQTADAEADEISPTRDPGGMNVISISRPGRSE